MTPGTGLCVNHDGVLLSVTGERMPLLSEPCWQLSLPQLSPGCQQGMGEPVHVVLEEIQVRAAPVLLLWSLAMSDAVLLVWGPQVQRLVDLFPTCVHVRATSPVQALSAYINCSQGGSVLELSDGVTGRIFDRFLNYTTANASHDQINKTVLDPELTFKETQVEYVQGLTHNSGEYCYTYLCPREHHLSHVVCSFCTSWNRRRGCHR